MVTRTRTTTTTHALDIDGAREVIGLSDKTETKRFVGRAATAYKSADRKATEAKGQGTLLAALAVGVAVSTGYLAARGERSGGEVTGKEYADLFGVSPSTVTSWRLLAHAVLTVGIVPESGEYGSGVLTTWQHLAFRGVPSSVSDAVYAEGATPESVAEAIAAVRNPDGTNKKATGTARPATKAKAKAEGMSPDEAIKADPVKAALAFVALVKKASAKIAKDDREGWAKVESALDALLTKENTLRRETVAKKAAKKAA